MPYVGIILHHSVCPAINGKGYDFFITESGTIIPAADRTDPHFIHICLEGDYSAFQYELSAQAKEQFFILMRLILRLAERYGFRPDDIFPHTFECPGPQFPWSELVISDKDGYH